MTILNKIKEISSSNEKLTLAIKEFGEFEHQFMEACFSKEPFGISKKGIEKAIDYDKSKGTFEDLGDYVEKYPIILNEKSLLSFANTKNYQLSIKKFIEIIKLHSGNAQIAMFRKLLLRIDKKLQPWYVRATLKNPRIGISFTNYNKIRIKQGLRPLDKFFVKLAGTIAEENLNILRYPVKCEIKYDGIRCVANCTTNDVVLLSRSGKDITKQFIEIKNALLNFTEKNKFNNCILDGEIISSNFNTLQNRLGRKETNLNIDKNLKFIIFDILKLNNSTTKHLTLMQRRAILDTLIIDKNKVFTSEYIIANTELEIKTFYKQVVDNNEEGIMIKHLDSLYEDNRNEWFKLKPVYDADLKVVDAYFGSGKKCNYISRLKLQDEDGLITLVGSGITDNDMKELTNLYNNKELIGKTVEIQYQEKTKKSYRFPRFVRIRYDK